MRGCPSALLFTSNLTLFPFEGDTPRLNEHYTNAFITPSEHWPQFMTRSPNQHIAFTFPFLLQKPCYSRIQNKHLQQTKGMFLKQKMKQWVSLVCLYQHRAFLTDLILVLNRQESHHYQMFPAKSTVLNKGWCNSKVRERTSGGVSFLSWDSVQLLLKSVFVGLLNTPFKWFIWGGREGKFLLLNSLWQLLCSFNIFRLLNKLRLETEKKKLGLQQSSDILF